MSIFNLFKKNKINQVQILISKTGSYIKAIEGNQSKEVNLSLVKPLIIQVAKATEEYPEKELYELLHTLVKLKIILESDINASIINKVKSPTDSYSTLQDIQDFVKRLREEVSL